MIVQIALVTQECRCLDCHKIKAGIRLLKRRNKTLVEVPATWKIRRTSNISSLTSLKTEARILVNIVRGTYKNIKDNSI